MSEQYKDYLGYIKYEGEPVNEGYLDARKSAEVLLGLDQSIRFFVNKNDTDRDFELPVRIRKGSWEVLIPVTFLGWVKTGVGIATTAYVTTAAKKLADNDFKDLTTEELVKRAIKKIRNKSDYSRKHQTRVSF